MWAVLYDDGMALTTASERVARSLAEAERRRGHRVTVQHLDDVEARPFGVEEPARPAGPVQATEPASVPGSGREAPAPELPREPEPARAAAPVSRRRLLLYALAAACIVVAAALAAHWGVLPTVGASTSSSPAQVNGHPQLVPPLDQPPVWHVSNATGSPMGGSSGGEP
jgi:hypothetical protein